MLPRRLLASAQRIETRLPIDKCCCKGPFNLQHAFYAGNSDDERPSGTLTAAFLLSAFDHGAILSMLMTLYKVSVL